MNYSIGIATMQPDGTIVLFLRAEEPGGLQGDGQVTYKKDSAHYDEVLEHLGGLKPGESKAVSPWPD